MVSEDYSTLDADVAEVRRRLDAMIVELKSLGLDVEASTEEYGLARDPEGVMTRTVNISLTVWDREN